MNSIACVVVTYNRLDLLMRCVKSLRKQTFSQFDIFVIDNGSIDGSKEWLDLQTDLTIIHQENVGGAGGFARGMEETYKKGYEWIWLMDDDGVADPNQLFELLHGAKKNNILFANALVCNVDDKNKLSFGLSENGQVISDTKVAQNKLLRNGINPFNGTFINRAVIDKIGFIKKEMFIWGDETEYTFRAHKFGISTVTITSAIHYHPHIKGICQNVIPFVKKYNVNIKPEKLSHIYYRNLGYIYKTYMPSKLLNPLILYTCVFIRGLKFKELKKLYRSYIKGTKGDFS